MKSGKLGRSFRLSPECVQLIDALTVALGVNFTAVVEYAVRRTARVECPEAYNLMLESARSRTEDGQGGERPRRPGRRPKQL